ncbi:MAG: hypothetical protein NDJ72_13930 [Elusimicrobia bacterium]|nr:hypothetical protein [Elusimicrobiota bacterium]
MKRRMMVVAALALALGAGVIALAEGGGSKMKPKHAGACPMHVPGAKVSVVNIESGVVIHVTGDAAAAAKIQAAASGLGGDSAEAKGGCGNCAGHGSARPAAAPSKAGAFACSMGDYSGPQTKDGRCPKCRMTLSLKKS